MERIPLTSPWVEGADVRRAQQRLRENRFRPFFKGEIDGVFGPETSAATHSAKFWLGYSRKHLNSASGSAYGPMLHDFLSGKRSLPLAYRVRRRARIKASLPTQREKALNIARSQLGITESPAGSNNVKYSRWFLSTANPPRTAAWCAYFVSWCFVEAGNKTTFKQGEFSGFVPTIVATARAGLRGLRTVSKPIPGDLVTYQFDSDANSDHIGIFEKDLGNGSFLAIEGNTSVGDDSNGGEVMRRERHRSQVVEFIRVQTG